MTAALKNYTQQDTDENAQLMEESEKLLDEREKIGLYMINVGWLALATTNEFTITTYSALQFLEQVFAVVFT